MFDQPLPKPLRYALQGVAYAAFAVTLGYFSTSPSYRLRGDDAAVVKLSFSHSARLLHTCHERSDAELAKLSPNMRTKMDCPRERSAVQVELSMDDKLLYNIRIAPTGLRHDGAATVYRRLEVPAGEHHFTARLADGPDGAFTFVRDETLHLVPGEVLIVDFSSTGSGFIFTRG